MVIHDDDVRIGGAPPHAGHEAAVVMGALRSEARVGVGGDVLPHADVLWQLAQLGAIAGLGAAHPGVDHRQQHAIARLDQPADGRRVAFDAVPIQLPPVEAEIVVPPLHQRGGERDAERVLEERKILEEDLFLQILGARGDQHAAPAQNGGDQIGDGLAGTGAGLGQQQPPGLEDRRDRLGHLPLAFARLVPAQRARQRTVIGEDGADTGRKIVRLLRGGHCRSG